MWGGCGLKYIFRTNIFGYEDFVFVVETGLRDNSENEYLYDWGEQNLSVYQMKTKKRV